MAKVRVSVVHDELGRIISVARPSAGAKVTVLSGEGHSVFETELEEGAILEAAGGGHRVDLERRSVVAN